MTSTVLVITDGMGPMHFELAQIVEFGPSGFMFSKAMDELRPISTQNVLEQRTDSAAAATAISTGVRTINGAVGQDQFGEHVQNFPEWLRKQFGDTVAIGVIAKVAPTHATPAGFLCHGPKRYDGDQLMKSLVEDSVADLIIGLHAPEMDTYAAPLKARYHFINYTEIQQDPEVLQTTELPYLAAYLAQEAYFIDYKDDFKLSLSFLVDAAVKKLRSTKKPFFLMAEASLIDFSSHSNNISRLVGEVVEADQLLKGLIKQVDQEAAEGRNDTFQVLFTSDHETGGLTVKDGLAALAAPIPSPAEGVAAQNERRMARIAEIPGYTFSSTDHTNSYVYVGAYGAAFKGEPRLKALKHLQDIPEFLKTFFTSEIPAKSAGTAAPSAAGINLSVRLFISGVFIGVVLFGIAGLVGFAACRRKAAVV